MVGSVLAAGKAFFAGLHYSIRRIAPRVLFEVGLRVLFFSFIASFLFNARLFWGLQSCFCDHHTSAKMSDIDEKHGYVPEYLTLLNSYEA